jgi:hypothetical protein
MQRKLFSFAAFVFVLNLAATADSCGPTPSMGRPSEAATKKELKALYERLLTASQKKDEKALREILSDSYSQVTADGRIRTKEIRINETLSPDDKIDDLRLESFEPRVYQDSAVAICRVRNKGATRGDAYDRELLSTATFVKEGEAWRIAATSLSFAK